MVLVVRWFFEMADGVLWLDGVWWIAWATLLLRARRQMSGTTLAGLWWWGWLPWSLAGIGLVARWQLGATAPCVGYLDGFFAVTALVPGLAVLGARRPTLRAWPWFVIIPYLVVMSWPLVSLAIATRLRRPPELEIPALTMYFLVLAMCCGNYLAGRTRGWTLLAIGLLAALFWQYRVGSVAAPERIAVLRSGLWLVIPIWLTSYTRQPRHSTDPTQFTALLTDFSELYGLVWSRRLVDRLNALATQHQWPATCGFYGMQWQTHPTDKQLAEVEHALRWLLRRFVDPPWIDARLQKSGTTIAPPVWRVDS